MGLDSGLRNSKPQHYQYIVNSYWIGVHPITNKQWKLAVKNSNQLIQVPMLSDWYNIPDMSEHPVVGVSGNQCREFTNWLGEEFRLPSEPEWEFAARGPDNLLYPFGNEFDPEFVIGKHNSNKHTVDIGTHSKGAAWTGAQDMSGHVWEVVNSLQISYPYPTYKEQIDIDSSNLKCVHRGGSFRNDLNILNLSARRPFPCKAPNITAGFRIVMDNFIDQ